jgi:hypothetical protein
VTGISLNSFLCGYGRMENYDSFNPELAGVVTKTTAKG